LISARASPGPPPSLSTVVKESPELQKRQDAVLDAISATPQEIGQLYRERRSQYNRPYLKGLARHAILDRPLIRTTDNRVIAPIPHLVGARTFDYLANLCKDSGDTIGQKLTSAVELHAKYLLSKTPGLRSIVQESDLKRHFNGQCCDLVYEHDDGIVPVEIKCTTEGSRVPSADILRSSTATGEICKGILQLRCISRAIEDGTFVPIGITANTTACKILITLSEIPFANTQWYYENVLNPRLADIAPDEPRFERMRDCVIISLRDFEKMICYIISEKYSVSNFISRYTGEDYSAVGEIGTYLESITSQIGLPYPNFIRETGHAFIESVRNDWDELRIDR